MQNELSNRSHRLLMFLFPDHYRQIIGNIFKYVLASAYLSEGKKEDERVVFAADAIHRFQFAGKHFVDLLSPDLQISCEC